jgi:quercetin dioxygenase-like cupin family protein
MADADYPEIIRQLPEADVPFKGVRGWILQGLNQQVLFMDIEPIGEVAEHSHGEQWGIVIDGEMDLTIGGETRVYRKGDSYLIPAGTPHSATFRTRVKALDFFADKDRYAPKA